MLLGAVYCHCAPLRFSIRNFMNRRIEYASMAVGVVLLVSGFAKALDAAAFARMLSSYGSDWLRFAAPAVILAEIACGSALLLGFRLRLAGAAATSLLVVVTVAYAYGVVFRDADDCGCFGSESVLNGPPVVTFLRNAVLIGLSVLVWRRSDNRVPAHFAVVPVMCIALCTGVFICGYTFRADTGGRMPFRYEERHEAVAETPLADWVKIPADSTYLVFTFSYTCPHCLNSIENLKRYEEMGAVDKVIALAPEQTGAEVWFRDLFRPEFELRSLPPDELLRLTDTFPTAYYIRRDTVRAVLTGELPAAIVFQKRFGTE